jgi:hypothetical protein
LPQTRIERLNPPKLVSFPILNRLRSLTICSTNAWTQGAFSPDGLVGAGSESRNGVAEGRRVALALVDSHGGGVDDAREGDRVGAGLLGAVREVKSVSAMKVPAPGPPQLICTSPLDRAEVTLSRLPGACSP